MTISLAKFCRNKNRWWERWGTWSWSEENTENFFYQHTELAVRLHVEHKFPPSSGGSRVHLHLVFQLWPVFFFYISGLNLFLWAQTLTCTMSLTSDLSVLILARCSPLILSPIQVMSVNLARLLMASPVVNLRKQNRRASSGGREEKEKVRAKGQRGTESVSYLNCR